MTSDVTTDMPAGRTPGQTLRQTREAKGLTLTEVAKQLHLTEQSVKHLEADQFEQLSGTTFARGYLRSYAKLLGLNAEPLVQAFDQSLGSQRVQASQPKSFERISEPSKTAQRLFRAITFLLLLAIAGIGFAWWQQQAREPVVEVEALQNIEIEGADGQVQVHPVDEPALNEPVETVAADESVVAEDNTPAELTEETASVEPTVVAETQTPATEEVAATPEAVSTTNEVAAVPPVAVPAAPVTPAEGEGHLQLQFDADCWTQVTDAQGKILFSGIAKAGNAQSLVGKLPLSVRLGYAPGVRASFNGQAVDLAPHVRGQVATLKLGQ